jgi:hypothetical protein
LHVLSQGPQVLGIGEAHALAGMEHLQSTTARFTEQLLPATSQLASDIVIELMEPDARCQQATEQVREVQKPVTQGQATSNQNEFVALGTRAKALQIQPHVLYPSCAEYERIVQAGEDRILVMLELIASLTFTKTQALLQRNQRRGREALVLLYGGAAHNDIEPRSGRELWSYGPSLKEHTGGRYVELDLIVREFIKDTEAWRSLPWYSRFDPEAHPEKAVLLESLPGAFVLFFPKSA